MSQKINRSLIKQHCLGGEGLLGKIQEESNYIQLKLS
jgi:hypothetical protein